MLFVVGLRRFFSVAARMDRIRPRYMGMMRRFLVLSSLVVLCCFIVVAGGVSKMFVRLPVVFGSFFRHCGFLPVWSAAIVIFSTRIRPPKFGRQRKC